MADIKFITAKEARQMKDGGLTDDEIRKEINKSISLAAKNGRQFTIYHSHILSNEIYKELLDAGYNVNEEETLFGDIKEYTIRW